MKTHKFDTLSFVSGLLFTGFGLLFLIPGRTDELIESIADIGGWAWPILLLAVGLAIVIPAIVNATVGTDEDETELEGETV